MIDRLAAMICYSMYKKQLYSHTQIRQIQYGLQGFISETLKIFLMCIILILTGHFKYGLLAMVIFSSLRIWAGGYHANSYFRCFIITAIIIYLSILFGLYVQSNILFFIQGIIAFIIIYIFAPADHENQPIISQIRRKKIHIIALGVLIFWIFVLYYIFSSPWKYIGINVIFIEALSILYMVYTKK
ncbi:accessory gene regulator ArgB-like protein [Defluviitalea phaphyphila]|uniref:accessory gene regulator ArgB-like protein n=1 Tax=Defluviitalea phaphyphila TaxID=1473580 RepID=UPI00072FE1C3|nr:accessory gene regulator B family protein [Defluviitalea phaphyphila]